MKKILLTLFIITFLLNIVSAQIESIGPYSVGECVVIKQTCSNCTYSNISSVISPSPNSSIVLLNTVMNTTDNIEYNYDCLNLYQRGTYIVNGYSDVDGTRTVWSSSIIVGSSIILWSIIIGLAAFFLILSLFGNTEFFLFLSGGFFVLAGIFGMIYGISTLNDIYTRALSIPIIALGLLLALGAYLDFGSFGGNKQEDED